MITSNHQYISLAQAAAVVEEMTGHRPAIQTLYRWVQRGIVGVRLETVYIGGHQKTTRTMLTDFFARVTEAKSGSRREIAPADHLRAKKRAAAIYRAEQELRKDGI